MDLVAENFVQIHSCFSFFVLIAGRRSKWKPTYLLFTLNGTAQPVAVELI